MQAVTDTGTREKEKKKEKGGKVVPVVLPDAPSAKRQLLMNHAWAHVKGHLAAFANKHDVA